MGIKTQLSAAIKSALSGRALSINAITKLIYDHLPDHGQIASSVSANLNSTFKSQVRHGKLLKKHPDLQAWQLKNLEPKLRSELDRRIAANINLIVLNRDASATATVKAYAGWLSSITGVEKEVNAQKVTADMLKEYDKFPFYKRRVTVDQGHKFVSALDAIVADEEGAIAAVWHSQYKRLNYNYREEHRERDGKIYLIRNSWAHEQGLVKVGEAGYSDEITQPGEEVYCSCFFSFIYRISKLPNDMITKKGQEYLAAKGIENNPSLSQK